MGFGKLKTKRNFYNSQIVINFDSIFYEGNNIT